MERENRLRRAREAQRVSSAIDAEIAEAKKAWDKKAKAVKILLLGAFFLSLLHSSHILMDLQSRHQVKRNLARVRS